ncbi:hypothetical protein PR202_ga00109 [Eleusine coracana subsp. coracana]|uniref:Uncharacterized protein n=1 Tax=Eleusine coracana subsp. coracana TaxID=191504 RepID=A0AAV5BCK7_ELECO|nr:hypothetical protein PR202_ga00109 [Eleusine coracana subsp. coracana]
MARIPQVVPLWAMVKRPWLGFLLSSSKAFLLGLALRSPWTPSTQMCVAFFSANADPENADRLPADGSLRSVSSFPLSPIFYFVLYIIYCNLSNIVHNLRVHMMMHVLIRDENDGILCPIPSHKFSDSPRGNS